VSVVGDLLLVGGAVFVLIGAIGVIRFNTPTERLHAAAKGPTLGLLLLGAGTAVSIGSTTAVVSVVLVIVLQLLAGPLGSHMIGRVIHRRDR
jgi:multicomponent Na+:H+ antiporter subunit G